MLYNPSQRQYSNVTGQVLSLSIYSTEKKEYSVKYMDGQVVNFTEYYFFSVEKEGGDNTCPVTILPLTSIPHRGRIPF